MFDMNTIDKMELSHVFSFKLEPIFHVHYNQNKFSKQKQMQSEKY